MEWEVGDIQRIAHRDDTFDTVISCETIEHVPEPPARFANWRVFCGAGVGCCSRHPTISAPWDSTAFMRASGSPLYRGRATYQPCDHASPHHRLDQASRPGDHGGRRCRALSPNPRPATLRIHALDRARSLTRWVGLHSLVTADKP